MLLKILLFLLDTICGFFTLALLVRFVMQWVRAPFRNPLGQFIVADQRTAGVCGKRRFAGSR